MDSFGFGFPRRVIDRITLRPTLWAWLNVDVAHVIPSWGDPFKFGTKPLNLRDGAAELVDVVVPRQLTLTAMKGMLP